MLKKFRTNIDTIDKKLLDLLNQRANIAKQVADYKKSSNNKTIFRPDRESQNIKSLIFFKFFNYLIKWLLGISKLNLFGDYYLQEN